MLRRLGVIVAAVAASLAFAASAQAAPSAPVLKPIPYWVCGSSLDVKWSPSTPDPGAVIVGYRVDIGDLTAGTSSAKFTSALGTTLTGLIANHHYVVRVRALQKHWWSGYKYSNSSADTFVRQCLYLSPDILKRYIEYNPWPECIRCGNDNRIQFEDPVIHRALADAVLPQDGVQGLELDGQGGIIIIGG